MAKRPGDMPVTLPLLDRLMDYETDIRAEAPPSRAESLRELKAALRRDIEWLFNTRHPVDPVPQGSEELEHSLYLYGLPDVTSLGLSSTDSRKSLGRTMEQMLATFEPRLANPKVTFHVEEETKAHLLRFSIEGYLRIDPAPEYVTFDTAIELLSGDIQVKGNTGAR